MAMLPCLESCNQLAMSAMIDLSSSLALVTPAMDFLSFLYSTTLSEPGTCLSIPFCVDYEQFGILNIWQEIKICSKCVAS